MKQASMHPPGSRSRVCSWTCRGGFWSLLALLVLLCTPARAQHLEVTGHHIWQTPSIEGVSALELSPNGQHFAALSDRGWYLAGSLQRSSDQAEITGVTLTHILPLMGLDGRPSAARRVGDFSDAEGLVVENPAALNGPMWISFERWARVERFESPRRAGEVLPGHALFKGYPDNRQLEALARHPDGTLYSFSERARTAGFALYRFGAGGRPWEIAGHVPNSAWYAIVGADFDAQGRLFVLERRHVLARWWQSRVRLVPDITRPEEIQTLWSSRFGAYGNFEGIAVWGSAEAPRITLVSDNNGNASEVTEFLDLLLHEGPVADTARAAP